MSPLSDTDLHLLVTKIYTLNPGILVNVIKKSAQHNNIDLTPCNIGSLFDLTQQQKNLLFLDDVTNDEMRSKMLSAGADINGRTSEGRNCLWGIKEPNLLKELIKLDADVNAVDNEEETPLSYLLASPSTTSEEITAAGILLTNKANPNLLIKSSVLLLPRIMNYNDTKTSLSATTLLCMTKIDVNNGNPLFLAVEKRLTPIVRCLLDWDARTDIPDKHGEYVLHKAITKDGDIILEIVTLLLQHNASPNKPYADKITMPLHVAVQRYQPEVIKKLMHKDADKTALTQDKKTPYQLAKAYNATQRDKNNKYSQEILDLLCDKKPKSEHKSKK